MSDIFSKFATIIDDITSLEVATLTSDTQISLVPQLSQADRDTLNTLQQEVATAKQSLNTAEGDTAIATAQTALDTANANLAARQSQLGVFEPKSTFARIQAQLGSSPNVQVVGYSKFELDCDALNFINKDPTMQSLVESHSKLVAAAQKSRTDLYHFVAGLLPNK